MSRRTRHLPEAKGLHGLIRELRYHEASRQLLAIALIVLFSFLGRPWDRLSFALGAGLVIGGALIRLWASGHVKKNKELATDGPYAYVRHPLYVGNIVLLMGYALVSGLWWSFPLLLLFFYFYYPTAIAYEDYKLHKLFADAWLKWREKTRALIPTFGGDRFGRSGGAWSLRQSLRQNGEPLIFIFLLYCLYRLYSML